MDESPPAISHLLNIIRLFRRLFGPPERINSREIESMGLLATKIAQMYAARPDLLSPDACQKLAKLYESATPVPFHTITDLLETRAHPALKPALTFLSESPLATASLGQVHAATLQSGENVVVKFIRPNQVDSFDSQVTAFRRFLKLLVLAYPKLKRLADPLGTLETIRRTTTHEINLLNEHSGTQQLRKLRNEGIPQHPHLELLHFPNVRRNLSTKDVLVTEHLHAPSIRSLLAENKFPYHALLQLFRIHGYFLFIRGQFHGDLHPGNVLYEDGHFWLIDNANVESAPTSFTRGLLTFLQALGREDLHLAANTLLALGQKPHPNPNLFHSKFTTLYDNFLGKTVAEASLTTQMMKTVRLAVETGLEFSEGAFPVIRSLMYLDGMALQCGPNQHLLRDVLQFSEDLPS